MKRLFAAIKIQPDADFLHSIQTLKTSLNHESIKWVETQNIHITLKFFGETPENHLRDINRILDHLAKQHSSFHIQLKGLGIFGSAYTPRVIWVGITPYFNLSEFMKTLHESFIYEAFPTDHQNFVPHLTLGRIKMLKDKIFFQKVLNQYRDICSLPLKVNCLTLFESILKREGPEYIILKNHFFKDV